MKTTSLIVIGSLAALLVLSAPVLTHAQVLSTGMSIGSSGANVTALQQFLAGDSSIYPEGIVSGYYGSLTQMAVTRFQARYGISQTGTVGPITFAKINSLGSLSNGSTSSTSGPLNSPLMKSISTAVTSNSITFNWITDKLATTKVYYGTTFPFLYATAPVVSSGTAMTTSHTIVLQGLAPNTTYYYTLESIDVNGNVTWSLETPITTTYVGGTIITTPTTIVY